MQLVLVESPTKSKSLQQYLGKDYKVLASFGHVRDLPKSKIGIDIEHDFEPSYILTAKTKKVIKEIKESLKKSDSVILATDPDREGESIAWHLAETLNLTLKGTKPTKNGKTYQRVVFHEITKDAIKEAFKHPGEINMDLVDAQQARRILDRIVGYKLSPFLWKKIVRRLSAGRVQSVAVRFVCEREKEIENFIPEQYWSLTALLKKSGDDEFEALLIKHNEKMIPKMGIKTEKEIEKITKELDGAEYKTTDMKKKEVKRNPLPPFTTSTLQQEAWQKFRFPARLTMGIAQKLYETGKITYHRTDSFNLSDVSLKAAKEFIIKNYGKSYWPGTPRHYKTTKKAQEAHEAIRPTNPEAIPSPDAFHGTNEEKLYSLIWKRFIACQMNQAIFDATTIDISANNYVFRANGQTLRFDGFLKVYPIKFKEAELPIIKIGELLELIKLSSKQHFTQPPPRYNEATLIKTLEENGIGRPSTYAPILSTIQERNYIEKDEDRRFRPTEIGIAVNNTLVEHFPEIVDVKFTAKLEENLDKIASNKKEWVPVIKEFYEPFAKNLEKKYEEVPKKNISQEVEDKKCPECGSPILLRFGRFGKFYACSTFPKCKYTESVQKNDLGIKCPKCLDGDVVEKRTKKKRVFYGCNRWPKCDFAAWDKPTGKLCPQCNSAMVITKSGINKCSNKECGFKEKFEI